MLLTLSMLIPFLLHTDKSDTAFFEKQQRLDGSL
jgi:hypothetical protein